MDRWTVTEATRSRRTPPRSPAAAHYAAITAGRPRGHQHPGYFILAPGQMLALFPGGGAYERHQAWLVEAEAHLHDRLYESVFGDGREFREFASIPKSTPVTYRETWWERVRRWIAG